ncbi:F-box only 43, partial [Brachionus plicatilis]
CKCDIMFDQQFIETKLRGSLHHRNSFDAGYESLLSQSSFVSNQSRADTSIFSAPATPAKTSSAHTINCNSSATSPDFKQQYVADVSSIYFASIRTDSYLSPTKVAALASPLKSPKFDHNILGPADDSRPQIKSFTSRFESSYAAERFVRPSPTEEEFMELLIKNKHLPRNPENLIGRNMGLDHFDILTGLAQKTMLNLTDKILGYMHTSDLVRVASVCRAWRSIVRQNNTLNRHRVDYLKSRKYIYEKFKENRPYTPSEGAAKSRLSLEQKRRLLKEYRLHNSMHLEPDEASALVKHDSGSYVFANLDNNCLNNINSGSCREEDFTFNKKRRECGECEQESPSKRRKSGDTLNNELFSACNSLFECVSKSQQVVPQRPGLLEKQFEQISLGPVADAAMVVESSPVRRRSPLKRQISVDSARCVQICSKKSKRNLKRL